MCDFTRATTFIELDLFFFFFFFFFLLLFSKTTIIKFAKIKSEDFVYEIKKRVKIDVANSFTRSFNLVAFLLSTSTTTKLLDEGAVFLKDFLTLTDLFMTATAAATMEITATTMQRREDTQIIRIYQMLQFGD